MAFLLLAVCTCGHARATEKVTDPAVASSPTQYPASAVAAGEQGVASVKALVEADGHVSSTTLNKSSGHASLDAAARQSVAQWTFTPATRNGVPEARWVVIPVGYQLQEAPVDGAVRHVSWLAIASSAAGVLGTAIWLFAFGWSVVLAKRKSILWLSGMVALWLLTYPLFVATHWSLAKRNLLVVAIAFAFLGIGFYLGPYQIKV
ncbi:energy transducer TonB [Luteibacter sp. HA06]